MGVLVSSADFQNVAVDTRTAVWVSTVEKTVLSAENLGWSERQLCIKWMRLVYLHSIFSLRFVFYIWWGNRKQRRPYPLPCQVLQSLTADFFSNIQGPKL